MADLFVKRYKVGFKGTTEFDNLVPAKNQKEARLIYARKRGIIKMGKSKPDNPNDKYLFSQITNKK